MNINKEHHLVGLHCGLTEPRLINHLTQGKRNADCVCGTCLAVRIGKEQVNNNGG